MFTLTLYYFDFIQKPACNGQGHKHYSEFISGLRFRKWTLKAAAAPLLKTFNKRKENAIEMSDTGGTRDPHSSLGALRYSLQFSVVCKDVEMPVSCISGLM
jgi:hypothetical protein